MATKKSRRIKHPARVLITTLIVVVLIAGCLGYYFHHKSDENAAKLAAANTSSSSKYPPPAPADNNPNNTRKTSSTPTSTLDNGSTSTPSNNSGSYTVQINPVVSNGNVHVGTIVSGTTSGSCTLTATQDGQSTLQLGTSSVKLDVNNYDCGVFNIPTSEFTHSGTWDLTLTVSNDGTSGSGSANATI